MAPGDHGDDDDASTTCSVRKELLKLAMGYLQSLQCSKVVTLAHTSIERDEIEATGVELKAANMLTLDLPTSAALETKPDGSKYFTSGPVDAAFDTTVCSHWRSMWNEVGVPDDAMLPGMDDLTVSYLRDARARLQYQTFLTRCSSTNKVIDSVSCQSWEGPFPKIAKPALFQLGTIWAVYVHPDYRRRGVAITLMKQALRHFRAIGCDTTILIAASEGGQCVYEGIGFRPNNALVCDMEVYVSSIASVEADDTEEKKSEEETQNLNLLTADKEALKQAVIQDLNEAMVGLVVSAPSAGQVNAMRTATIQQLRSLFDQHPQSEAIIAAVSLVQTKHGLFVDPSNNWFTQNLKRLGRGFNMKQLERDPSQLASKCDRLSAHYDDWTVGNSSKVESFIVRSTRLNFRILPVAESRGTTRARVLDIACAIGLQGQVLRLCGFKGVLIGTDISQGMVNRSKERGCYDHVCVINANHGLSPLGGDCYDVVICTGAMELSDQSKVLADISSVTVPGGEVCLYFHQHDTTGDTPGDDHANPTQHQGVRGITQDEAVRLIREAGFADIVSVETCLDAFYTPSPAQDGSLIPVPYVPLHRGAKERVAPNMTNNGVFQSRSTYVLYPGTV